MSIPIFIINLDKAVDRWEQLENRMNEIQQQNYFRFRAFDKNAPNLNIHLKKNNIKIIEDSNFKEQRKGESACALSHKKLLEKIVELKYDWAIILEDDVRPIKKIPTTVEEFENANGKIPINTDVIFLNDRINGKKKNHLKYLEELNGYGLEGYMVSNSGAKKLLKLCDDITKPIDLVFLAHVNFKKLKTFRNTKYQLLEINGYRTMFPYVKIRENNDSYIR